MFLYIAIHKDENTGYGVTVPSLPGCFSYGDTLEQAIEESKQAILFHIEGLLEDGIEPETNQPDLATLINDPEYAGAQWFGIEMNIDHLTLKKVDTYVSQTHDTRSNFLAKAALERINSANQNAGIAK